MTDTQLLDYYIKKKGYSRDDVAGVLGITRMGFHKKINNQTEFKASEIKALIDLLEINDVDEVFFKEKSDL